MMFPLDGCWLSAWGTVARSGSSQSGYFATAITDQERKEQHMEQFRNLFGSSVGAATVARATRGTHAPGNFPFVVSSRTDSEGAFYVAENYGRNRERQAAGFE